MQTGENTVVLLLDSERQTVVLRLGDREAEISLSDWSKLIANPQAIKPKQVA